MSITRMRRRIRIGDQDEHKTTTFQKRMLDTIQSC